MSMNEKATIGSMTHPRWLRHSHELKQNWASAGHTKSCSRMVLRQLHSFGLVGARLEVRIAEAGVEADPEGESM